MSPAALHALQPSSMVWYGMVVWELIVKGTVFNNERGNRFNEQNNFEIAGKPELEKADTTIPL